MNADSIKYFIFGSIISADNDEFTEETKQEIIRRFDEMGYNTGHANDAKELSKKWGELNWEYVLEPIGDPNKINRIIKLFRDDNQGDTLDSRP